MRLFLAAFAFLVFGFAFGGESAHKHQYGELPAAEPGGDSVYQLESEWIDHGDNSHRLNSLAGRPVVCAMIYTSCEYACPLIVGDMLKIHRALSESERVRARFVLFSFDPERDTPEKIGRYLAKQKLPSPDWAMLSSDNESSRELSVALGVRYKNVGGGEFAHSNLIFILDKSGAPIFRQEGVGNSPDKAAAVLRELWKEK